MTLPLERLGEALAHPDGVQHPKYDLFHLARCQKNGGIYFESAEGVWDALGRNADLAWAANEQFLENQLKSGIDRIDFVGESIEYVERNAVGTFRWREIDFLNHNASMYGYERIGNSWVKWVPSIFVRKYTLRSLSYGRTRLRFNTYSP